MAYIYAHLLCASKFPTLLANHRVKGDDPFYRVSDETFELIRTTINEDS